MKLRTVLVGLGVLRIALALIAIPLAPFLYREHFVVLVLLRPTKEVMLAAGFLVREGLVDLLPVVVACVPLALAGVWLFFVLGRSFAEEIRSGDVPGIAGRVLTPKRIGRVMKALDKKGPRLVLLGRTAALSSATVAAAAGAARMERRTFLLYDSIGALISLGVSFGAGWLLEGAYDVGPWITFVGLAVLVLFAVVLGRQLMKA